MLLSVGQLEHLYGACLWLGNPNRCLICNTDHLLQNFAEGSDYIKMLVQVFAGHINGDGHDHLQNFYVSIPPLCVNFVDHISGSSAIQKDSVLIMCCSGMKERLSASGKLGSKATCFTDDGFAMGEPAYIGNHSRACICEFVLKEAHWKFMHE